MTRKTRRSLKKEIERLRDDRDDVVSEFTSEVVEITEDDVDENGNVDVDYEPPDGHTAVELEGATHPCVTVYRTVPIDDPADEED